MEDGKNYSETYIRVDTELKFPYISLHKEIKGRPMLTNFKTLTDLMIAFQDPQTAIDHFSAIRWAGGVVCPYCEHDRAYTLARKNKYRCAECCRNFSVTVGTIFENTKLPLRIWFGAIWLITNHPKGIASTTLAKDLGITQKSAWFVLHRLRHAAATPSFNT